MRKDKIKSIMEELILINIKENIDYYYKKTEKFKKLKKLIEKVETEKELFDYITRNEIGFMEIVKETINDLTKLPEIYDFVYEII